MGDSYWLSWEVVHIITTTHNPLTNSTILTQLIARRLGYIVLVRVKKEKKIILVIS